MSPVCESRLSGTRHVAQVHCRTAWTSWSGDPPQPWTTRSSGVGSTHQARGSADRAALSHLAQFRSFAPCLGDAMGSEWVHWVHRSLRVYNRFNIVYTIKFIRLYDFTIFYHSYHFIIWLSMFSWDVWLYWTNTAHWHTRFILISVFLLC